MKGHLYEPEVLAIIEARIKRYGSASHTAKLMGISPQYLHDIRLQRRGLSDAVLNTLGLERVTMYRRIERKGQVMNDLRDRA